MTDVLLAHAFFLKNDSKQIERLRPYPPLGTLYAASNLRSRGFSIELFDAMLSDGEHEFEAMLDASQPRIVVFYEDQFNFLNKMCLKHTREATGRMSAMARARGAHVVAAGSDVTDHPKVYFERGVEYALVGEADHTLGRLVEFLLSDRICSLPTLPGLRVVSGNSHTNNGVHQRIEPERDPDVFPFPAWDLVDAERYREVWHKAHGYFSVNMVSTRGCPFHCNWCAKPIWGQRYAMRSPANVAQEMALVKDVIKPDRIWFADDIFGLQPRWVIDFAEEVEALEVRIPIMIQSRVDLMTERSVEGLARAGCYEVWLGVESGSQKILDAMDKGIKLQQVSVARQRLDEAGIKACFFLQFGYPGETWEDIMDTVNLVRKLLPDGVGVSVSYPLPGTKFHDMVSAQLKGKHHWDDSNDLAMMFQGRYQTPFYRKLHELIHRDLEFRRKLHQSPSSTAEIRGELDALTHDWFELGQLETQYRSDNPTPIHKSNQPAAAPNLTRRWN